MKYPNSRQCSNLLVLCEEVKNNTPQVVLLLFLNKVCMYTQYKQYYTTVVMQIFRCTFRCFIKMGHSFGHCKFKNHIKIKRFGKKEKKVSGLIFFLQALSLLPLLRGSHLSRSLVQSAIKTQQSSCSNIVQTKDGACIRTLGV